MLPRAQDHATARLFAIASACDYEALIDGFGEQIFQALVRSKLDFAGSIDTEQAAQFLADAIEKLATQTAQQVSAYGAARWLWYLRRLPDFIFEGQHRTTLGYDKLLAEALTWEARGRDVSTDSKLIAFPVNDSTFRHICRLVAAAKAISHLHSMYRRVGKGAQLQIQGALPIARASTEIEEAIRIYDDRHDGAARSSRFGLGLSAAVLDASELAEPSESIPLFITVPCEPVWVPLKGPDNDGNIIELEVLARHVLQRTSFLRYVNPFSSEHAPEFEYVKKNEPLLTMALVLPMLFNRVPWALRSCVSLGYFFVTLRLLREIVDFWLPKIRQELLSGMPYVEWSSSFEIWISRAKEMRPGIWPLTAGGPVRLMGESVMLDVTSMSIALLSAAEVDRSASDIANIRSNAFEMEVQSLVDVSAWKPQSPQRAIRGRVLRIRSQAMTDIDAVGERENILLLISCKSLIYDRSYDRGDHRVIRNSQSTVDQAVEDWQETLDELRRVPVGDNYDFSRFEKIIGVVCTPFAVYSDAPATLEFVAPGLRRCSSFEELAAWLEQ